MTKEVPGVFTKTLVQELELLTGEVVYSIRLTVDTVPMLLLIQLTVTLLLSGIKVVMEGARQDPGFCAIDPKLNAAKNRTNNRCNRFFCIELIFW